MTVQWHMIATEIGKYPDLSKLRSYILKGFPKLIENNLHSFLCAKDELSIEEGIFF